MDAEDFPDQIIEWQSEAEAVINDVKNHVAEIVVSTKLASSKTRIFLNLTTLEMKKMTVSISGAGFQIVGNAYDTIQEDLANSTIYDTPYAMLGDISPSYTQSFGTALTNALQKLI